MIESRIYKSLELFVLFVLIPVQLVLDWSIRGRLAIAILGFIYVIGVTLFIVKPKFVKLSKTVWSQFLKSTGVKFFIIALLGIIYVYYKIPDKLFYVVIEKPKVWLFFLGVYSLISVLPQEFLYRTFFFERYSELFLSKTLFIILNAGLFSLAHLFFANSLVMLLTFIGGLLFAYTYSKTNSVILVIIEHILYGCWLYTLGMGEMLGFPA